MVEPEVNFETACFSPNFNCTVLCSFEGKEQAKEGEGNLPVTPDWPKEAQESLGNEDWVVLSEMLRALEKQPTTDYSSPYCGGLSICLSTGYSRGHKKRTPVSF